MTEHWKRPDGIVHIVGLHRGLHKDRHVFSECGIDLATIVQPGNMPLQFLKGNTEEEVTCMACLVQSGWETYAP